MEQSEIGEFSVAYLSSFRLNDPQNCLARFFISYFIENNWFTHNAPGDMGISIPTTFVSTNGLIPTRNALSTLFAQMDPVTGALPYSGPPLNFQGSDTYHAWTLIGTHNYYLYSGDIDWLQTVWANYVRNNIRLSAR